MPPELELCLGLSCSFSPNTETKAPLETPTQIFKRCFYSESVLVTAVEGLFIKV